VLYIYKAGAVSMETFSQWRISINGEPLFEEQRRRWKKEAAYWIELLEAGPVPGQL